jgi:hypothetical protein
MVYYLSGTRPSYAMGIDELKANPEIKMPVLPPTVKSFSLLIGVPLIVFALSMAGIWAQKPSYVCDCDKDKSGVATVNWGKAFGMSLLWAVIAFAAVLFVLIKVVPGAVSYTHLRAHETG